MAYKITDFDGTTAAPGGDYPFGDVKNAPGGTIVNKKALDDMWQFFQKAMSAAGITPNSLPDNVANGYQYYDAMVSRSWTNAASFFPDWAAVAAPQQLKCNSDIGGRIKLSGQLITTGNPPSALVATLPVGFSPTKEMEFVVPYYTPTTWAMVVIVIDSSGIVAFANIADKPTGGGYVLSFDSINFTNF